MEIDAAEFNIVIECIMIVGLDCKLDLAALRIDGSGLVPEACCREFTSSWVEGHAGGTSADAIKIGSKMPRPPRGDRTATDSHV